MVENKEPVVFLVFRIIGFVMLGIGVIALLGAIDGLTISPIALLVFPCPVLIIGFIPSIKRMVIKTRKYLINETKDYMKDIADTKADIASGAITKTVSAVKSGWKGEKMHCKHCGVEIDIDSKYCNKCGGQQ